MVTPSPPIASKARPSTARESRANNCKELYDLGVKAKSGPLIKGGLSIMDYEEAVSFQSLLDALKRSVKGTLWKESTAKY